VSDDFLGTPIERFQQEWERRNILSSAPPRSVAEYMERERVREMRSHYDSMRRQADRANVIPEVKVYEEIYEVMRKDGVPSDELPQKYGVIDGTRNLKLLLAYIKSLIMQRDAARGPGPYPFDKVKEVAQNEIDYERFRAEVDFRKRKLRERSWWDRIWPYKLILIRKGGLDV
jgi:cellobiose-specific phosphotransferase system component IIB